MFNTVPAAAGATAPSSQGALLLSIQQHLTGIYGLDLAGSAAREALMRLPVSEAVLRTRAGEAASFLVYSSAWPRLDNRYVHVPSVEVAGQS